jgi:hypothetical protein
MPGPESADFAVGEAVEKYSGSEDRWLSGWTVLEADGTLVPSLDNATMTFTRSCAFSSPSAAAAVVAGRPSNGRMEWVARDARITYGEWQTRGVEAVLTQKPAGSE